MQCVLFFQSNCYWMSFQNMTCEILNPVIAEGRLSIFVKRGKKNPTYEKMNLVTR